MHAFDISLPFTIDISPLETMVEQLSSRKILAMQAVPGTLIDKQLVYWLQSLGIGLRWAEIFCTPPSGSCPIHIDAPDGTGPQAKMNFAYGGAGSLMRWYEPIDPSRIINNTTPMGTSSVILESNNGRVIDTAAIGQPSIINAGVYHDVINPSNEPRWCLSLVMQYQGRRMGWETAKEAFAFCTKERNRVPAQSGEHCHNNAME
jgi:hypothetical protein